jgi:hypothetical protein
MRLAFGETARFLDSIKGFEAYVVKSFYPREAVAAFRDFVVEHRRRSAPSWHPCLDGLPDYHRINDEYPQSYVRGRLHGHYFHRWNENRDVFGLFKEIFVLKNHLTGAAPDAYYENVPSDMVISRVVVHQYPRGGGYLEEHLDPVNPFALIQTIVQASTPGADYSEGGLYVKRRVGDEPVFLDPYTDVGDLMVASPDIVHGVAPVDPREALDWSSEGGRWIIIPAIIRSDYNMDPETKPKNLRALSASVKKDD